MNTKTYGRKALRKRQINDNDEEAISAPELVHARKRQKVHVEVVQLPPATFVQGSSEGVQHKQIVSVSLPQPSNGKTKQLDREGLIDDETTNSPKREKTPINVIRPKPRITYGSPRKSLPHTEAPQETCPVSAPSTPRKPAKDLTQIFEAASPSPSPSRSASKQHIGPSGIAKRMLSRSRTESSLGSSGSGSLASVTLLDNRNISHSLTPSKSDSVPIVEPPSSSIPSCSTATVSISSSSAAANSTTRTYAGKSRSFLVSLPAPNFDDPIEQAEEDEFATRESYTSLRARWGVDFSEDDPYPAPPSPHSPPGKGKGKGSSSLSRSNSNIAPSAPLPNGMMNDLKSITELRSKGESRRFLDEVGYLFEGMDPKGGLGLRRASALEIVTKLCDPNFARKARAADFFGRTWDVFYDAGAGDGDKILDTILVFFAALVAQDPPSLSDLAIQKSSSASKPSFTTILLNLLASTTPSNDILSLVSSGSTDAELRRLGISRTEKIPLTMLHALIKSKSLSISDSSAISTRLLVSLTLVALPPSALRTLDLPGLLKSLQASLVSVPERLFAYISGLPLLPILPSDAEIPAFAHIDNCLRLLDSYLLGQWSADNDDNEGINSKDTRPYSELVDVSLAQGLVSLCVVAESIVSNPQYSHLHKTAHKCTEMTFRVLLSLTHENPPWCSAILSHEFTLPFIMRTIVRSHALHAQRLPSSVRPDLTINKEHNMKREGVDNEDDSVTQILDRLYLALGLLTNLVQVDPKARDLTREIRLDSNCTAKRACIPTCTCAHLSSGLSSLARLYTSLSVKSEPDNDDAGTSFLRGHLAILFGLLMRRNLANQRILLGPENRIELRGLLNYGQEFMKLYAKLHEAQNRRSAGDSDVDVNRDEEEQRDIVSGRAGRDAKGQDVAQDVLDFLQTLHDEERIGLSTF